MLKSYKLSDTQIKEIYIMNDEKKKNLWPLLFIGIFGFTFSMIIWTIISTSGARIEPDQSFNSSYHKIDRGYNDIYKSTQKFKSKYNIKVILNKQDKEYSLKDAFVSARELERDIDKNNRKSILHVGNNNLVFVITDKKYRTVKNVKFDIIVMNNTDTKENMNLNKFNSRDGYYKTTFNIPHKGRWNITGYIEIDGVKGYYFYKDMIK
jgi:hypothetical protein